jgi:hypothetical protein
MTRWIGAAILALTVMLDGSAATNAATAEPLQAAAQKPPTRNATDLNTRRSRHPARVAHRLVDRPYYADRPTDYAPLPSFPLFSAFGYGPWW